MDIYKSRDSPKSYPPAIHLLTPQRRAHAAPTAAGLSISAAAAAAAASVPVSAAATGAPAADGWSDAGIAAAAAAGWAPGGFRSMGGERRDGAVWDAAGPERGRRWAGLCANERACP